MSSEYHSEEGMMCIKICGFEGSSCHHPITR